MNIQDTNQGAAFQREVSDRIIHKVGELTAANIELGAMGDALTERMSAMQERGAALQTFADQLTAALAVRALSGQA